jgi:hypothetical protein
VSSTGMSARTTSPFTASFLRSWGVDLFIWIDDSATIRAVATSPEYGQ